MIGKWLNIHFLEYLDPVAGAVVAFLILKMAYDILKKSVRRLMDSSPDDEKIKEIKNATLCVDGVIFAPRIKGRYVGSNLYVDMEIEVSAHMTVEEGHEIAAQTQNKVIETVEEVYEVLVHVEPRANIKAAGSCEKVLRK